LLLHILLDYNLDLVDRENKMKRADPVRALENEKTQVELLTAFWYTGLQHEHQKQTSHDYRRGRLD
jgi:hypothetical protein